MRFIVDLWLDGYETAEETHAACEEFIKEQLDMTASSVTIVKHDDLLEASRKVQKLLREADVDFGDCDIMHKWEEMLNEKDSGV